MLDQIRKKCCLISPAESRAIAMSCCNTGPGYASPEEAFRNGARERLLYIPCIVPSKNRPDYLVTIDCDPWSKTYSQVGNLNKLVIL